MIRLFYSIIVLGIASITLSCKKNSPEQANPSNPIPTIDYTQLGNITEDYDSVFTTDTISRFRKFSGVVLYVNSQCSFCIASAISFIRRATEIGYSDSVVFITPTFGKPSLEFNLNKFKINELIPFDIIEDRNGEYILDEIADYSGTFFVFNQGENIGMYQALSPTI